MTEEKKKIEKILKDGQMELGENLRAVPNNIDESTYTLGAYDFVKIVKPRLVALFKERVMKKSKTLG